MNRVNKKALPKNIVDVLDEGEVHPDNVKLFISALSKGNRARRIIIWLLYNIPHLWQASDNSGKRPNTKEFKAYLSGNGIVVDPTELCRSLKAAEVEQKLGLEIGTCSIGALRPIMPLSKKKESRHIQQIWADAEELAGDSNVKAHHVEEVLAREQYSEIGKKKTKKPLAIANNEKDRLIYRNRLVKLIKNLTAAELADLIKRAKKIKKAAA